MASATRKTIAALLAAALFGAPSAPAFAQNVRATSSAGAGTWSGPLGSMPLAPTAPSPLTASPLAPLTPSALASPAPAPLISSPLVAQALGSPALPAAAAPLPLLANTSAAKTPASGIIPAAVTAKGTLDALAASPLAANVDAVFDGGRSRESASPDIDARTAPYASWSRLSPVTSRRSPEAAKAAITRSLAGRTVSEAAFGAAILTLLARYGMHLDPVSIAAWVVGLKMIAMVPESTFVGMISMAFHLADRFPSGHPAPAPEALLEGRRPADLSALLSDRSVLLVGESHHDLSHYRAVADSLVELKKAGLTHIAVELPASRPSLMALAVLLPHRAQLWLQARLLGIKVVPVDGRGSMQARNEIMAGNILDILDENPRAKILFPVGARHLEAEDAEPIQDLLRAGGVPVRAVTAVDARSRFWSSAPVSRAIHRAGLEKESFYAPLKGPGEVDGVLHLPEYAFLSRIPRPWTVIKRWLRVARNLM